MAKGGYIGINNTARKIKKGYIGVPTQKDALKFLEYIESTGTQYIDTGWNFGTVNYPNVSLEADVAITATSGTRVTGVGAYTSFYYGIGVFGNGWACGNGYGDVNVSNSSYTIGTRVKINYSLQTPLFTVEDQSNGNIIANSSFTPQTPQHSAVPFLLSAFKQSDTGAITPHAERIYSFKIFENEKLIRDFVPCQNASGEIGMYDNVHDVFYPNAGTGTFTAGEVVEEIGGTTVEVARKIKKAYMGVGGVAKLIWGRGELLYYGTATALSYSRGALAATTVGNYALFGGGSTLMSSHISSRATSTVNAYDSSLTMSVVTSLTTSRSWLSAASIGGYAIFAGGSESTRADGYNGALTRISVPNLSEGKDHMASTTVGDYVLFSTGRATGDDEYGTDYATYNLDAYNSALTKSSFRWAGYYLFSRAATTVGGYALFGGGTQYISGSTSVVAIDASLTQTSASPMTTGRISPGAASVGNYALFGGGESSNNKYTDTVDAYNASLTKSTASPLSIARAGISGISLGDFALFAGGGISAITTYNNVDSYDASLTKTTSTPLNTARQHLAATKLNNYALFGGGFTTSNSSRSAVVDVYQLV